MNKLLQSVASFAREDDGSQVVEYALIIAVVSIGLVVALSNTSTGIGSSFTNLVTRLRTCFTTTCVAS